jgi:hypothetical protein
MNADAHPGMLVKKTGGSGRLRILLTAMLSETLKGASRLSGGVEPFIYLEFPEGQKKPRLRPREPSGRII